MQLVSPYQYNGILKAIKIIKIIFIITNKQVGRKILRTMPKYVSLIQECGNRRDKYNFDPILVQYRIKNGIAHYLPNNLNNNSFQSPQ